MTKGPNETYHDRIAARYDDIYDRDPYWDYYFEVGSRHLRRYLPADLAHPVLDAGCGTGLYGLALMKSGYRVTFSDLSNGMLERARQKVELAFPNRPAEFVKADLQDLAPFADETFSLLVAQGDPLSFVADPRAAVRAIRRVLRPGGVAVCSVDSRFGGVDPLLARDDLGAVEEFLRTGQSEWLAERREERFPSHAFTPTELRSLGDKAGLETLSLIGKTVLDLRKDHAWLRDRKERARALAVEMEMGQTEFALGRAHHLQVVWKRIERR